MGAIRDIGTALWSSLTNAMTFLFTFIPRLLGFLVILLIGWIVAAAIAKGVTLLLRRVGFDRVGERIGLGRIQQSTNVRLDAADLLGKIVYWFVFLIFLIPAFNALGLTSVSGLLGQVIGYLPNVFVAILVLFLGTLFAHFLGDIVFGATAKANIGNPKIFATITRVAIIGFAILIALQQLQIAPGLITTLFTAIVGAVALAFGLAFGVGGQDTARRALEHSERTLSSNTTDFAPEVRQHFNESPNVGKLQTERMGRREFTT